MTRIAELPDGTRLSFPDETPDEVMDRAVNEYLNPSEPDLIDRFAPSLKTPQSAYKGFIPETIGLGEKGLNILTGGTTGLLSNVAAGFTGLAMLPFVGHERATEVMRKFPSLTYEPRTEVGRRGTIVGDVARDYGDFSRFVAENTGGGPLGKSLTQASLEALPLLLAGRKAIRSVAGESAPLQPKPPTASSAMNLDSVGVLEAGERIVTQTFKKFREVMGDETVISTGNTVKAIGQAVDDLVRQGKSRASITRELRNMQVAEGMSVANLDDVISNLIRTISNPKATGARQARSVLEAIVQDMDVAGKPLGLNFADDLATSRAFADLYKNPKNLGRTVRQHGERLEAFKAAEPASYQEIVIDWSSKQLKDFVRTNARGGREFNTQAFSRWVSSNEASLTRIVGPETVAVWKAFPKWEGRAGFISGLAQRVIEAKTGGLSRFFNREIDMRFAEGMAEMLTNPESPLFRALQQRPESGGLPLSARAFETEVIDEH